MWQSGSVRDGPHKRFGGAGTTVCSPVEKNVTQMSYNCEASSLRMKDQYLKRLSLFYYSYFFIISVDFDCYFSEAI